MINDVNASIHSEAIKPCYVNSCTECSMYTLPDGSINIRGMLHRQEYTKTITNSHGTITRMDCAHCPVHLNLTPEEWEEMLAEIDGTE